MSNHTDDLPTIEARLRAEFSPAQFFDLLIRSAARTEMAHCACEAVANSQVAIVVAVAAEHRAREALETRVRRLEEVLGTQ